MKLVPIGYGGVLDRKSLDQTYLTANIWNAKPNARVEVQIDDMKSVVAERDGAMRDPYALAVPQIMSVGSSTHLWKARLPSDLTTATHWARVTWVGDYGQRVVDAKTFEVADR